MTCFARPLKMQNRLSSARGVSLPYTFSERERSGRVREPKVPLTINPPSLPILLTDDEASSTDDPRDLKI